MKLIDLRYLPNGLFEICWNGGGTSVASIGSTEDGGKWIAPCNWLRPLLPDSPHYKQHVRDINSLIRIR